MGIRVSPSFLAVHAVILFCFSSYIVPESHGVRALKVVGNETDQLALLEFKSKIIDDPFGVLGSWNGSIHFCQWHGVTCSRRHRQRVTRLDLQSLKLVGSISPHIGNLSFLTDLFLQNNSFTREIPLEIGYLRRLKLLRLHDNTIGGVIPANISRCSNLIRISLADNQFVGKIPSEFGSLSKIEWLFLGKNHLTGSIPSSLGNLSSISDLDLPDNNLEGNIPNTFGLLRNLERLGFGLNRLSSTIPSSIFNISSIRAFDVGENQIEGRIPLNFGFTLPNLQFFSVAANHITGIIPPSISNASKLEVFQVSDNNLTGEVPSMEKLIRLLKFRITNNSLGSNLNFLCSLTNATNLFGLNINVNNFEGLLPGCINNFSTTLEILRLDNNKIYGNIPTGIGKFINLQRLEMWNNQLSGTIPTSIGELKNLGSLGLGRNRLSGNIPPSVGNLKRLLYLSLGNNLLEGSIPSSLSQCENLVLIDLSFNNLSGTIPPQVIGLLSLSIAIDLRRNRLTGSLPTEVGKLINLEELYVAWNMLEGEIPSTLASCIRLEQLSMQGNLFQGHIPSSLSSLRGLTALDLSRNNLSGEIPEFFKSFKSLQYLNLSYNDLVGVVPIEGVFKNASATSILGNTKLCGGITEFQLPQCSSKKSERRRLTHALKLVIAIIFGLVGLAMALSFLFFYWARKRQEKQNPSSSINSLLNLSYQNLYNATDGFSSANLIGVGSFGTVYKGILDDCTLAVKVFNLHHRGGSRSFITECNALRNIRHRNLVKILTACSGVDYQGNEFKALVYEFMHNGSLEEWLHPVIGQGETNEEPKNLNLLQRLNIAIDVACALNYLHHGCQPPIAHCDIKPSNILLDDEMSAHVADFGLTRFLPPSHRQTGSIGVKGSIGYIPPEYGFGSEVSTNGDVYSYGILLLELVTRKRPTDIMFEGDLNLHNFAKKVMSDHEMDIVDSTLLNDNEDMGVVGNQKQSQATLNNKVECLISIVRIGVSCSMESPQNRMNINDVIHKLQSIKNTLLKPTTVSNMQRGNYS